MTIRDFGLFGTRGAAVLRAGLLFVCSLFVASAARAVSLSVVSTQVQNSSDTASVCVALNSEGKGVVGIANELSWSTDCASGISCEGGNIRSIARGSGGFKVIVLDMKGLNPIPDGILYCCTLRMSLDQVNSCAIQISDAQSSDAGGQALPTVGRPGIVQLASSSQGGGGLQNPGAPQPQQPVVSADLGGGGQQPSGQPAQGVGQNKPAQGAPLAGGGGAPAVQPGMLPGEQVAQAPAMPEGAAAEGTPTAAVQAPGGAAPAKPAAGAPVGATAVPKPAAKAETPVQAEATAVPVKPVPTVAKKPIGTPQRAAETKRALAATPAESSGCNCQIGAGGDGWSGFGVLLGVVTLLWARRRRL